MPTFATNQDFINELRFNDQGLIPAIAQDWLDGAVLMMAWMNKSSLEESIKTGQAHYWSRSRNELWHKGSTSGHTQIIKEIRYDCDSDVILLIIDQTGSISCHKGERSCFFKKLDISTTENQLSKVQPIQDACSELFEVIKHRKANPQDESYTNKLLAGGDNKILKKIGEESAEFVMACKDDDESSIANEAADIIYHLQVALAHHKVTWRKVLKVLALRKGAPRRG